MKIKDVLLCWDFIFALIIAIILNIFMFKYIQLSLIIDILSIIISTLSIIFSLFFAGMSIILTSNDDDFINFLEEDNIYSDIISTFKFTLSITFISLIIHIMMYFIIQLIISNLYTNLHKWFILFPTFIFFYSIFATFNSVIDAIKYAEKRIKYIKLKNKL